SPSAFAAPVDVGIIDCVQLMARRKSLCGLSSCFRSVVYACTVVINPSTMQKCSSNALTTGAKQIVVHEALEIISCLSGSYCSWLTPMTDVQSTPSPGAVMITFFAPA